MNQMNTPETDNVQEIDLVELAKRLWSERKFLFKCCGVAIVVGLVVAFSIPKEYSTTVKLAPETSDPSKKMGNLGGLAAMAGINLNSTSGADAISPDLYPDVVSSIPFLLELFPVQVTNEKGDYSASLYDYMNGKVATTRKRFIFFKHYPKVEPGSEIVVPAKTQQDRKTSLAEILSITSSTTSMAAMITSIINTLK